MALGDVYGSLALLKARFSISDEADDTELERALEAASYSVEQHTGRQFNKAGAATARLYHPTSRFLTLVDDFHTTDDLAVETDTTDDGTFDKTWAASDFQVEPLGGLQGGKPGWPFWRIRAVDDEVFYSFRRASVRVTAQWGWDSVPEPVVEATMMLAAEIFKMKDAPFGVAGWSEWSGPIAVRDNPKIRAMLAPFGRGRKLVA